MPENSRFFDANELVYVFPTMMRERENTDSARRGRGDDSRGDSQAVLLLES